MAQPDQITKMHTTCDSQRGCARCAGSGRRGNLQVKKIHTGFSGPGTGVYYAQFKEDFNETVNELLAAATALN
jgi:hypothetical protein